MRNILLGIALVLLYRPAFASITIGNGAAIDFADATLQLGCSDLIVSGRARGAAATINAIANLSVAGGGNLAPGASSMSLGGNFSDAGTFVPGSSRIAIVDTCGSGASQVSGATHFHDFIVSSASGKQLVLPVGIAQTVTHALTLSGAAGNLLQVLSAASGQRALLTVDAGAAQTIAFVRARDNDATNATIAPGAPASYQSVDGGDLVNWFTDAVTEPPNNTEPALVPASLFDHFGRVSLMLVLLIAAHLARRRRYSSENRS